jgi:quercetin dioxygenase-like cupin family protein
MRKMPKLDMRLCRVERETDMPELAQLKTPRSAVLVGLVAAGLGTVVMAQDGQQPLPPSGLTRSNHVRIELVEFPGSEAVAFNGNFAPGATSGRHRHPGSEIFHVISGRGVLLQDGQEPMDLVPGTTVVSEPGEKGGSFVHEVRNLSTTEPLRTYVVLLVDAGEPPSLPAD